MPEKFGGNFTEENPAETSSGEVEVQAGREILENNAKRRKEKREAGPKNKQPRKEGVRAKSESKYLIEPDPNFEFPGDRFVAEFKVRELNGEMVYTAKSPTGKTVVLDLGAEEKPKTGSSYLVRITKRNRPKDVFADALVVEPLLNLDEEAQFHRAEQLRNSPQFRVLAKILRRTPEIFDELRDILPRRAEFELNMSAKGQHHRDFTALFAAIHKNGRAAALLNLAIDRSVAEESEKLGDGLNNRRVHDVVIGTGPHSAIYRSERLMYRPDDPGLAIEREKTIGGQFAQPEGATFSLNSRNRPENKDMPHLPGTKGSLNTQGAKATVHLSDLSGQSYPTNWDMAQAVRDNQFLLGDMLVDKNLLKIEGNRDTVVLSLEDRRTGRNFSVFADRVILTSGIGQETTGLDESNPNTASILRASERDLRSGRDAQVYKFSQLMRRLGDSTEPFPLQGWKKVITWGKGDSWKVAAGSILGYEMPAGKTVTQLDRVEEVIAIGQERLTKEEFLKCERARYAQLGLEFPREKAEAYYHRVKPFRGRALRLEKDDKTGEVVVVAEIEDDDGDKRIMRFRGDHAVAAAGFKDDTDKLVEEIYTKQIEGSALIAEISALSRFVGASLEGFEDSVIRYFSPNDMSVRILEVRRGQENKRGNAQEEVVFEIMSGDGSRTKKQTMGSIKFLKTYLSPRAVKSIAIGSVKTEKVYTNEFEDPVAVKYKGIPVYRVGPNAKLPLTESEKARAPVLKAIPENTASIFRYADYTAGLARALAKQDVADDRVEVPDVMKSVPPRKIITLPPLQKKAGKVTAFLKKVTEQREAQAFALNVYDDAGKNLPAGVVMPDLMNFVIGERSWNWRFPEGLSKLTFRVGRSAKDSGKFEVSSDIPLPGEYGDFVTQIFNDEMMQRMLRVLTDKKTSYAEAVEITIPIIEEGGECVVNIGSVTYVTPRRSKNAKTEKAGTAFSE